MEAAENTLGLGVEVLELNVLQGGFVDRAAAVVLRPDAVVLSSR